MEFILRLLGGIAGSAAGYYLATWLQFDQRVPGQDLAVAMAMALGGAGLGLLLTPYVTTRPARWVWHKVQKTPIQELLAAVLGLILGLLVSALLSANLSRLPGYFGQMLPFVSAIILGYLGAAIMVMRKDDLFALFLIPTRQTRREERPTGGRLLLDTSTIIDGRIGDISQTGFINSTLVVPRFVLEELQRIADSAEMMRRNRGRRGLDVLSRLQRESPVPLEIMEFDVDGNVDVDGKLVRMAKELHCPIITNDFNLNRVAGLQGVRVLNINELANAVRSVLLPGEDIEIRIIQEGKEPGQGVGYLDDGTMVVVENGRKYINTVIDVTVTRVLQTAAGRMIFAQPKIG